MATFPLALAGLLAICAPAAAATLSCTSSAIAAPSIPGLTITSLTAASADNICQVTVVHTHPGTGDNVTAWISLPLTGWNGRFQGVGGGGYLAGYQASLAPIAAQGYACVSTDAGHTTANAYDATPWALISPGNVNQYLLLDFAYRSYHDMTLLGKAITESFYGTSIAYSYWNGCSTGGRQGFAMAQRYPADYNGILADAPAIQWNDFTPAQQWPYTVMNNEGYVPTPCELEVANAAAISACDALDGQTDGIISAPGLCTFEASSIVGQTFSCSSVGAGSGTIKFSQQAANVVQMIWDGPVTPQGDFLWYGPTKGTNLTTLAETVVGATGTASAVPFVISDSWYKAFLYGNDTYNTANVSYTEFARTFLEGHLYYDSIIGTNSPDLRAFKRLGNKIITWQGLADNLIMPQGTQLYYQKLLALDPTTHTFYRQFFSPGIGHCGGGTGVLPIDAIGALRAWVENGTVPDTLAAASTYPVGSSSGAVVNGTNARYLNLCPYPQVQKFKGGKLDPSLASSYSCVAENGWLDFGGPSGTNYSCEGGPGWY